MNQRFKKENMSYYECEQELIEEVLENRNEGIKKLIEKWEANGHNLENDQKKQLQMKYDHEKNIDAIEVKK